MAYGDVANAMGRGENPAPGPGSGPSRGLLGQDRPTIKTGNYTSASPGAGLGVPSGLTNFQAMVLRSLLQGKLTEARPGQTAASMGLGGSLQGGGGRPGGTAQPIVPIHVKAPPPIPPVLSPIFGPPALLPTTVAPEAPVSPEWQWYGPMLDHPIVNPWKTDFGGGGSSTVYKNGNWP